MSLKKVIWHFGIQVIKAYPIDTFRDVAGRVWFHFCRNAASSGHRVFHIYRSHKLASAYQPATGEMRGFLAGLLFHFIIGMRRRAQEGGT